MEVLNGESKWPHNFHFAATFFHHFSSKCFFDRLSRVRAASWQAVHMIFSAHHGNRVAFSENDSVGSGTKEIVLSFFACSEFYGAVQSHGALA